MKLIFAHLLLCVTLLSSLSCSKDHNSDASANKKYTKKTIQYKSVVGVDSNLLSLDIYHFGQTTLHKPVIVYVHGGGFAFGDKANDMANKLNLFSSLEYILVSINYRLSPGNYSTDPDRVMYPTHHSDVADAMKWIYDNIGGYGGNNQKMALLGHSAGAQLIALVGTSQQFLPSRGLNLNLIKGVACIDTEGYDVVAQCNEGNRIYLNAFGQANAFWFEASPINNVVSDIDYPKFFIAKRGSRARIGYSDSFASKLRGANVGVTETTANQYDHDGINRAIGANNEKIITEPLKEFFLNCFQ